MNSFRDKETAFQAEVKDKMNIYVLRN